MNPGDPGMAQRIAELPLRDIHLPLPVGWWPIAPGWWLTIMAIIAVALLSAMWVRRYRSEKWRRAALEELDRLASANSGDGGRKERLASLSILVRRICLERFTRDECASLTGAEWLAYLDNCAPGNHFSGDVGVWLTEAPYRRSDDADLNRVFAATREWVVALPARGS
jgi:hypothetical protein